MTQNQISIPYMACPKCLFKLPAHKIDGEQQIVRHYKKCDEDPPKADGWVEAAELAGVESAGWHENWRKYAAGWDDE